MKYTLCIKLNIDGNIIEQELATFSLESLEKYTSYCDIFSDSKSNEKDFINCLGKTHPKIANFLNKHKVSEQPLFIKCGDEYTDIPILYKKDIDVLLITKEELNQLLDCYGWSSVSSFEDKIRLGVNLKKSIQKTKLFDLNKEVTIINKDGKPKRTTEKEKRIEKLNEDLDKKKENYWQVVKQIESNIKPLVDAEERKSNKSEEMKPNYVVTGMRHDEDADENKKYTINDELTFYEGLLLDKTRNPEEREILSMLVDTTREVIEYRKSLQEKIKLRDSKQKSSNVDLLNNEITRLQIILAEKEKRMEDLANGNVYFGDGRLEIDDPNYGGKN